MLVAGISLVLMFIVFFISFLGNHRVIWLQKLIIIPLLLFLLVLIFLSINHPDAATSSVAYWPKHFDMGLITQGMILAFFAFGGWESFASMTGEIKRPARTVPFVIFVGFLLTVGLYVGLSIAIQKIFFEKSMMMGSSFLLDLVQVNHLGQFSVAVCFFIVFVVVIANLNGVIWSGSRTLVTLGQKGWAPAFLDLAKFTHKKVLPLHALLIFLVLSFISLLLYALNILSFSRLILFSQPE